MNKLDRALAYLEKLPPAISGAGGHDSTYRAACTCIELGLSYDEVDTAMGWYNDNRCNPKWNAKQLAHKIKEAHKHARPKAQLTRRKGQTFTAPATTPKENPVPVIYRTPQEEEAWWARIWSERGLPDPASVPIEEFRRLVSERGIPDPAPTRESERTTT